MRRRQLQPLNECGRFQAIRDGSHEETVLEGSQIAYRRRAQKGIAREAY